LNNKEIPAILEKNNFFVFGTTVANTLLAKTIFNPITSEKGKSK